MNREPETCGQFTTTAIIATQSETATGAYDTHPSTPVAVMAAAGGGRWPGRVGTHGG